MPVKLREFASKKFNSSCRLHDIHYELKTHSRWKADWIFLKNMFKRADGEVAYQGLAVVFYLAVVVGGWYSWKKA